MKKHAGKKIAAVFLTGIMVFSLAACGGKKKAVRRRRVDRLIHPNTR